MQVFPSRAKYLFPSSYGGVYLVIKGGGLLDNRGAIAFEMHLDSTGTNASRDVHHLAPFSKLA